MSEHPIGPEYDPKGVYVGSLRVGRDCFDHNGTPLKVVMQGSGSTLVRRAKPMRSFIADGKRVTIKASYERVCISHDSVVYTHDPTKEKAS